jgi:hypothetical protein
MQAGHGIRAVSFADTQIKNIYKDQEAKASESRSYRDENERDYYALPVSM